MNKFKNILKNKIFLTIFLSGFVFLIVLLFSNSLIYIDKKITYSMLSFKNHFTWFSASKDIVIIEIDNKTLNKFGYPYSRNIYTKVIKNLNNAWASVIWIDVIFWEQSNDDKADNNLALAFKNAKNIIIGNWILKWNFNLPYSKFIDKVAWYWFFNPKIYKKTNSVYSVYPSLKLKINNTKKKKLINYFPIEILKYYFKSKNIIKSKTWLTINDYIKIPFSQIWNNEVLINYLPRKKFYKYSLLNIYKNDIPKEKLKGKIILIWATAEWLKDTFNTPNWIDYWVYIHANFINTVLSWKYLTYFNPILEWFLIFLLIITALYLNFSQNSKIILFSNFSILIIFIFLPLFLILSSNILLNHPASIVLAFILSLTFSNITKYLIENKDKKKVLKALWEYISKDIAKEILSGSGEVNLKWERKKITTFFSDIEGFTTISEKLNPEELVKFLQEYLWAMTNIILDEQWMIDKYEWDAIMALWWVFWKEENSSFKACNASLKQQKLLKILNKDWKKRFWEELRIRMWLNTWEAIVWNIWAIGRKIEFTALWDSVNLASRLEEINKKYWTYICVSENIYKEQKNNFEFRFLDRIRVKWKEIPVSIYELLSEKWKLSDFKKDIIKSFTIWIKFYLNKEFKKAYTIFEKLSKLWDKPSITYAKRCLQFEINPPKDNWDWVWTMKTK